MKINNTIKVMKEIEPNSILLVKAGSFYNAYGKDTYILSYLFGYQIKNIENTFNTCGLPTTALNKVLKQLEENKINYLVVNKTLNYEVENKIEFKKENKYSEIYEKSYKYVLKRNRINSIYNYLLENINSDNLKEKLSKIEDVLYDIG